MMTKSGKQNIKPMLLTFKLNFHILINCCHEKFLEIIMIIAQNIHVTVDIDKYMLYFPFINGWEFDKGRT